MDLLERYMARQMSPDEEREFMRMVESDPALRRTLEAERAVRRALLRDRDALPVTDAAERASFIARLSSLPDAASTLADGAAKGSHWFSGAAAQGTLLVCAVVASIAVWNLAGPDNSSSPAHGTRAIAPASVALSPDTMAHDALPVVTSAPLSTPRESSASMPRHDESSAGKRVVMRDHPAPRGSKEAPMESQPQTSPASSFPATIPAPHADVPPKHDEPPIRSVVADSMRVDVKLNLEKLKRVD